MVKKIKAFIFGCSKRAKDIEDAIADIDSVEIIGYVDNDKNKWETFYLHRKVYSPDEAYSIYKKDEAIFFLIAPQNFKDIERQLRGLGVERIFIHLYELLDRIDFFNKENGVKKKNKQVLLISNGGFPMEENKYRSGFVYRRLLAYKRKGIDIDAYGYIRNMGINEYIFEGNQIYEGDAYGLSYLLNHYHYNVICIHFPTEELMHFLEKYVDRSSKVLIWIHGYEVLKWERRSFIYSQEEINEKLKLLDKNNKEKVQFFKRVFKEDNYSFVFVSNWLKNTVREDIGSLPKNYRIIPNFIDSELYQYIPKNEYDATKVLLIKSNKSRVYANDIAVKTIEELVSRKCFKEMEFNIYGDGILFEDNYKGLMEKNYPNVHINRKFLSQLEIAELHKTHGIFLSPTRQDSQGVSMCEAMSSGLVVITNNVAAIPEYINKTAGILCSYEDHIGMADALERLYNDRELFMRYSENAARFVNEKCSYANTIQLELQMIENS